MVTKLLTSLDDAAEYANSEMYRDLCVLEERRKVLEEVDRLWSSGGQVEAITKLHRHYELLGVAHQLYVAKVVKEFREKA